MSLPKPRSWNLGAPRSKPCRRFFQGKMGWEGNWKLEIIRYPQFGVKIWGFLQICVGVFCIFCYLSTSRWNWDKMDSHWVDFIHAPEVKLKKIDLLTESCITNLSSTPRLKNTTSNFEWFHSRIWSICSSMFRCYPPPVFTTRTSSVYGFQGFQDPKLIKKHGWSLRQGAIGLWHSLENQVWSRPQKWNTNSIC